MKRLVYQGLEKTLEQGLRFEEGASTTAMTKDRNVREGLSAFADRREPDFKK